MAQSNSERSSYDWARLASASTFQALEWINMGRGYEDKADRAAALRQAQRTLKRAMQQAQYAELTAEEEARRGK